MTPRCDTLEALLLPRLEVAGSRLERNESSSYCPPGRELPCPLTTRAPSPDGAEKRGTVVDKSAGRAMGAIDGTFLASERTQQKG